MATVNHYKVLGVAPTASQAELKAAYTRLARQVHPDLGGSSELFILVQEAWEVLGDPRRRAAYDAGRQAGATGHSGWADNGDRQREQAEREARSRAARVRPYIVAVESLEREYRDYHEDDQVPLRTVLGWRAADKTAFHAVVVFWAALTVAFCSFVSTNIDSGGDSEFVVLVIAAFVGLALAAVIGSIRFVVLGIIRARRLNANRRVGITPNELCDEYLRTL